MKKTLKKPLKLTTETLRFLTESRLGEVLGGSFTVTADGCGSNNSCADLKTCKLV